MLEQPLAPFLIVEYEPGDPEWQELCNSLDVVRVWPDVVADRL